MRIRHCRGDTISDYVIVGTGPGGATIANILTGDGRGRSAVVLEAGGNYHNDPLISDASYNRVLLSDFWPEFGWQGMSKNNPPTTNRNFLVPQTGRLVGGSSAIHNTNYVKASVPNLAQWEALLGPSWSPAIIYDAYKQLEHYYGVSSQPETRGEAGPVQVRQVPTTGPLPMGQKTSQALFVVTGIAPIVDYNAPATPNGPTPTWQLFQYPQPAPGVDAARSDAYTAFLGADVVTHPAPDGTMRGLNGRRLEVLLRATAQRILFEDGRAVGVLYVREGVSHVAYGRRGVISGAGFLSAQLLMVSGIGPRPTLETARVPVVYENENVGRNLSNHVAIGITFNANPADYGTPPDDKSATTTNGAFFYVPGYGPAGSRSAQYIFQGPITNLNQPTTGSMIATLFELQPFSRGTIDIQSVDFQQEPIVRYNYLLDPRDFTFFDNEIVNRILPFNTALNALDPLYGLPPATLATLSDPALRANFIRSTVRQTHHGCGMVRMAPRDQGGVVDANGHVYGVSGLVVADTSILPFQPDGNNCATVFATAWLIGQRIRAADGIDYDPCESRDRCRRRCRDE